MCPDIEIVNGWFEQMLDEAIQETEAAMSNEHIWELAYEEMRLLILTPRISPT